MKKIIYANKEHEVIVSNYITMIKEFVKDVSNDVRWKNYNQVYDLIVEYNIIKETPNHDVPIPLTTSPSSLH